MRVTAYIYFPIKDPRSKHIGPAIEKTEAALKKLEPELGATASVVADATIFNSRDNGEDEKIF
jgi:hypothetical protein